MYLMFFIHIWEADHSTADDERLNLILSDFVFIDAFILSLSEWKIKIIITQRNFVELGKSESSITFVVFKIRAWLRLLLPLFNNTILKKRVNNEIISQHGTNKVCTRIFQTNWKLMVKSVEVKIAVHSRT